MIVAPELQQVAPGLALWHASDPKAKAELFSTAIRTLRGLLLVDPIPLSDSALPDLLAMGPIAGIVVTNANHGRASAAFAGKWQVPLFGHATLADAGIDGFQPVEQGDRILDSLEVIGIAGAAPGEIALYLPDDRGSLILGDALVHFDPYCFTFLPAKYCTDHKQMKKSLRALLLYSAERMLFAHGTPILSKATSRLEQLLKDG